MPLAGERLVYGDGRSMIIVSVGEDGVTRRSSNGIVSRIPIEPFRQAIDVIRRRGFVTRAEIRSFDSGRYSSAVTAILGRVPELVLTPRPLTLCARDKSGVAGA